MYNYYIEVDERNRVMYVCTDACIVPAPTAIRIGEGDNPNFNVNGVTSSNYRTRDDDRLPRYLWVNGEFVSRSSTDIDADRPVIPDEPTAYDRLEAQVAYTAMMTDTLLEE